MKRSTVFVLAVLIGSGSAFAVWWGLLAPHDEAPLPPEPHAQFVPDDDAPIHRVPALPPVVHEPQSEPSGRVDKQWADKNRAAIQALEAGDLEAAIEGFDACHAAVPGEVVFGANLAEALARSANSALEHGTKDARDVALARLKRARELAPDRQDIVRRLEQIERLDKSEEGLWTEVSEHFELSYDGARSDISWSSSQITAELEAAYLDLGEHFGRWPVEDGRPRIRVVLYRRQGFLDATGIGHWAGGLFDGTVRVPLEDLGAEQGELARVLRHEIVHAFVAVAGGRDVPGWLNEGLAQWLEQKDADQRVKQITRARGGLRGAPLLPLADLKRSLASLKDEARIHRAYLQSLAFVDHIEHAYGERVLYEMVEGCKNSIDVELSFRKRTNIDLAVALADLARELE